MQENTLVTPGQRLGRVGEFVAGPGTYETDRHIVASLVGRKIVFPQADV
jgi:exosome complex RNA-binding protein Rrp4